MFTVRANQLVSETSNGVFSNPALSEENNGFRISKRKFKSQYIIVQEAVLEKISEI